MPIIVDEVVISVEVAGEKSRAKDGAAAGDPPADKQALIEECVERVLEILGRREER